MPGEHAKKAEGPKIDDPSILSELHEVVEEMLHEHILKVCEFIDKMPLVGRIDINLHRFFSKFLRDISGDATGPGVELDRDALQSTTLVIEAPVNEPRRSYVQQLLGFCPFPVVVAMQPEFSVRLVPIDPNSKFKPILVDGKEVSNRLLVRMEYDITKPAADQMSKFVAEVELIVGQYVVSISEAAHKTNDAE